jgi:hypothetical protein
VSELRSVLEAWEAEDPRGLAEAGVEEGFAELHRASERLEALRLRWLGEIDRRRAFERDGYLSTASWLKRRFRVAGGTAGGEVRMARSLQQMPRAREALGEGTVSMGAVKVLAVAWEADPGAYGESEEVLVAAARDLDLPALGRVLSYWRQAALDARDGTGWEQALVERRRLHVSPTVFGMVRIDGDLDPETGESVLVALRGVLDAEARSPDPEDARTPAQRRADALGVLARGWLDACDRGVVAGERPHLSVIVDLPTLAGLRGRGPRGDGASWSTPARWTPSWCAGWGVTPGYPGWWWDPPPCPWTWDEGPRWCRGGCAGPWWCGAGAVRSPPATGHRPGATPTTCGTRPPGASPPSRTWSCYAGSITAWCTPGGSTWRWCRDGPCSDDRTGRCWRTGLRRSG